jgi:hypothetical protein
MVDDRRLDYINCQRVSKGAIALELVKAWRNQDPPGRFLKLDEKTGLYYDMGDAKARKKTSQLLRENAPQLKALLHEEQSTPLTFGEEDETLVEEATQEENSMPWPCPSPLKSTAREHSLFHRHHQLPHADTDCAVCPELFDNNPDRSFVLSKRETSHQYETVETKRFLQGQSVKRSNTRKELEELCDGYFDDSVQAVAFSSEARVSTLDRLAQDLLVEPLVEPDGRASPSPSIDETLSLDLNAQLNISASSLDWLSEDDEEESPKERMLTKDLFDLVDS